MSGGSRLRGLCQAWGIRAPLQANIMKQHMIFHIWMCIWVMIYNIMYCTCWFCALNNIRNSWCGTSVMSGEIMCIMFKQGAGRVPEHPGTRFWIDSSETSINQLTQNSWTKGPFVCVFSYARFFSHTDSGKIWVAAACLGVVQTSFKGLGVGTGAATCISYPCHV